MSFRQSPDCYRDDEESQEISHPEISGLEMTGKLKSLIHPLHKFSNLRGFQPTGDDDKTILLVDDNKVAAKACGIKNVLGHALPMAIALLFVQPPHIAIIDVGY